VAPAPRGRGRVALTGILDLPARISALAPGPRERAERLIEVAIIEAATDPPAELDAWLEATFGSVEAVRRQRLARVTNLATLDSAVFAPLRARRPTDGRASAADLAREIGATEGDPFCDPVHQTPADTFGRVRGRSITTGANAGQADAHHAVLVFDAHDPLSFDAGLVTDLFATGRAWAERASAEDPSAPHYLLIWNCLWRAGGSIIHGHAQAMLGRTRPHAALDRFHRDAATYRRSHDADLVADLVAVHRDLGLAIELRGGVTLLAHLVPVKERELLVVGRPGMDERDPSFVGAIWHALAAYRDRLGVRSFNLALWRAPLDAREDPFPPIVRIVDRGDPAVRPSDIGAMELYGTPIVGSDPYDVIRQLRPDLEPGPG
jgi:hypothetical protein